MGERERIVMAQKLAAEDHIKMTTLMREGNYDWALHFQRKAAGWYAKARKDYERVRP